MKDLVKQLRMFSVLEGISFLVLLFNMLLIKPTNDVLYHKLLYPIGLAHGILFVIYVILVIVCSFIYKWSFTKMVILFMVSLIPFGTFWAEKKYLRQVK
jgi:integral membrane protein